MRHHAKEKSPQTDRGCTKAINVTAPISLEDLMFKERPVSLDDGDMRELSVQTDPANEYLTRVKQRTRILDHPQNLLEVLRARLAISQGLTGNDITTGPNKYHFTQTSSMEKRVFDLKVTGLRHKTVTNIVLVMKHVVTYFSPTECLSKQNHIFNKI